MAIRHVVTIQVAPGKAVDFARGIRRVMLLCGRRVAGCGYAYPLLPR